MLNRQTESQTYRLPDRQKLARLTRKQPHRQTDRQINTHRQNPTRKDTIVKITKILQTLTQWRT